MNNCVLTTILCFITPRDLREIADEMEQLWSTDTWGKSLVAREWYLNDTTTLKFVADQHRMKK